MLSAPTIENPFTWNELVKGKDGTILAVGSMVKVAVEVSKLLESNGIHIGVYNCRSVKPVDRKALSVISSSPRIWTLEEGAVIGGFGSSILLKMTESRGNVDVIGIEDYFVEHGSRKELLEKVGLSVDKIAERIVGALKMKMWEG